MIKHVSLLTLALLLISLVVVPGAQATVSVTSGPTSLVPDPILAPASSSPIGLFKFTLAYDAGETLTSVALKVSQNATTTVSGSDIANLALYKDTGNGTFEGGGDTLLGTQTTVELSPTSTVVSTATSTPATGTFFVTLATGGTWSDAAPADSIKILMAADSIMSSAGVVSHSMAETNSITADTTGPVLQSAIAKNTGGTGAKEAGDSVDLTFSEATNKPTINSGNVNAVLALSDGHSWLDSTSALGGAAWDSAGMVLTITLSNTATTSTSTLPTVVVGDTATVGGSAIMDLAGNSASGAQPITGDFGGQPSGGGTLPTNTKCGNGLINGRLYKVTGDPTVYLAAACRLKPFRGAAVFHARGLKFQNIIELSALPGGTATSTETVLPAEGTLLKGKGATVYLIVLEGMSRTKKGFRSAAAFFALGFQFGQITQIEEQDLAEISEGSPIGENESHPSGTLVKCGSSATVFQIVGNAKFPFRSADAFLSRGHSWQHIATVDCVRLRYILGAPISD